MASDTRSPIRRTLDTLVRSFSHLNPKRIIGASARNISLTSWLAVVVLTTTIVSLTVVCIVTLTYGSDLSDGLLEARVRALRSLRASQVELYLRTSMRQTGAIASSDMTVDAAEQFIEAYRTLPMDDPGTVAADEVLSFYRYDFGPELEAATGATVPWRDLVPSSNASVYLQHEYVTTEELGADNRRLVDDAGDGSDWTAVHREFHPAYLDITDRLGVDDLYIVDPNDGVIVYSTGKAPDFATSLDRGPYSASALATLIRAVRESPEAGAVMVADLAPYAPALGQPVGFFAAPIVDGDRFVAVLATRLPGDKLNAIMTSGGDWETEGLGSTGETYLVGADGRMRSISRIFVEDPAAYFAGVEAAHSLTGAQYEAVKRLGTTVALQRAADLDLLEQVGDQNNSVFETTNYVGRDVFASYEPVDIDQLNWFVAVEVGRDEWRAGLIDFRRTILIVVSVFVLVMAFVTVAWARRAFDPVRALSARLTRALEGKPASDATSAAGGPLDLERLDDDITDIVAAADLRRAQVAEATADRLRMLRDLLPSTIIDRLNAGDRLVVEQIFRASIAVVSLEGLGVLIRNTDAIVSRPILDRVVEKLDTISAKHGLERVKLVGDLYYAGCGLSHPYLDHAPRALGFALETHQGLSELEADLPHPLLSAIAIHTGPVSVGLAGSSRLVYDVWGETLTVANLLVGRAAPGEILVSTDTRDLLPPGTVIEPHADGQEPPAWEVRPAAGAEPAPETEVTWS